jgi:O-antigen/teichoic acid export membrane protein
LIVPVWLLRPAVSVRGSDADVASLSIALQFATPVFSLLAVLGQALWPFYAKNRLSLGRADVLRHTAAMGAVSIGLALAYGVGLSLLARWDLIGHTAGAALLAAMGAYIVARGAWEPSRIVFSTDRTARPLAMICVGTCVVTVALMWVIAGYWDGAAAVLAVATAFGANVLIATLCLIQRLREGAVLVPETGDDIASPAS